MIDFFKNKYTKHLLNIFAFVLCISISVVGSYCVSTINKTKAEAKENLEIQQRQQARRTLSYLRDMLIRDIKEDEVDVKNKSQVQTWFRDHVSGVLNGGDSGDVFVIELGSEQFIWDGSPDCAKDEFLTNGRFMKDESQYHQRPDLAVKALDKMRLGIDTKEGDNNYWQFDDGKEYLEWVVIPVDKLGFDNEPYTIGGIKNPNYNKILIQLGTQEDEAMKPHLKTFKEMEYLSSAILLLALSTTSSLFVFMTVYLYSTQKHKS